LPSPVWEFVHAHQQPRKHDLPGQRLPGLSDARLRLVVQLMLARAAVETVREARRSAGLLQMRRVRSGVSGARRVRARDDAHSRCGRHPLAHGHPASSGRGYRVLEHYGSLGRLASLGPSPQGRDTLGRLTALGEATLTTLLPVAGLAYLVWALRHARRECAKRASGSAH
jgi:hypothetical protein